MTLAKPWAMPIQNHCSTQVQVYSRAEAFCNPLTILSPVSGTVTGLNNALHDDPSLLQEDPYGAGWLLSVKPSNWMAEVAVFHLADDATAWLKKELERIRDFLALSAGRVSPSPGEIYMQDGGELAGQTLASMPEEVWNDFQKEFLK